MNEEFKKEILKEVERITMENAEQEENNILEKYHLKDLTKEEIIGVANLLRENNKLIIEHTEEKTKKEILNIIDEITSFTCSCGSVTFDNKKCRLCGKSPSYGTIDYEELKKQIEDGRK